MNKKFYFAPLTPRLQRTRKATKNRFFSSLLCIIVLALAPACSKKSSSAKKATADKQPYSAKASSSAKATADKPMGTSAATADVKKDVNTMIELDNTVFEMEEDIEDHKVIKF